MSPLFLACVSEEFIGFFQLLRKQHCLSWILVDVHCTVGMLASPWNFLFFWYIVSPQLFVFVLPLLGIPHASSRLDKLLVAPSSYCSLLFLALITKVDIYL